MAGAFSNQIVGLVRFSYPALNGFSKSAIDTPTLEAQLYDPARLERRFHLFENLTLPSLLAQSDTNFSTAFLIGTGMPDVARARLEALIAPLPGARLLTLPPLAHFNATGRAFARMRDGAATHLTGFRLDDDDALDHGFVARLRRLSGVLAPACGGQRPLVVGFNRGLFLELKPQGNRIYEVVEKLPLGIGLAMTVPAAHPENIFRRNHRLLPQFYTCFTDADTPAFIRTVHGDNDSQPYASGRTAILPDEAIASLLAAHFPFTLDRLMQV